MAGICRERPGDDDEKLATIRRLRSDTTGKSDEEVLSIFSNYGWIYVEKITNNSIHKLHYYNPYLDNSGDIDSGKSEASHCTGYLPLWSYDHRYEIEYYNTVVDKKKKILIKDLEGDWLASFYQESNEEDIRDMTPEFFKAFLTIVFTDDGYDVYESDRKKGGVLWGTN